MVKAIVAGGGLGGLAAALALRKIGFEVEVYEKRKVIGGGEGTTIVVAPNGMRALANIEPSLPDQIIAGGVPSPAICILTVDGKEIKRMVLGHKESETEELQFDYPFVSIGWGQTLQILKGLLPEECLKTGHSLQDVQQTEEGVAVTFETDEGGSVTVQGDLLVGADGIWSQCRRALFGLGSDYVQDQSRTMWRAMAEWDSHPVPGVEKGHFYTIAGPKTLSIADSGSNEIYFAFSALDSLLGEGQPKRCEDGEEMVSLLRKLYADCPLALEALNVVPPEALLERRVLECPVLDQWAKERAVLIGDAAHAVPPAIGQGANLAFEDAWDLSRFLEQGPSIPSSLQHFQAQRVPRVKGIADINRTMAAESYKGKMGTNPTSWDFIYTYPGARLVE